MTRLRELITSAVRAKLKYRTMLLPGDGRKGTKSGTLFRIWMEREAELVDEEDDILYNQVHVEGKPLHKALIPLLLRRMEIEKAILADKETE